MPCGSQGTRPSQTFARRVVQAHLEGRSGASADRRKLSAETQDAALCQDAATKLSLVFAMPDHPWVDTAEGAAVRITMTVGVAGEHPGELLAVTAEQPQADGSEQVEFRSQRGKISADLTVGANVAATVELQSNDGLANRGFCLFGAGFIVSPEKAAELGLGKVPGLDKHIRPYRNGKDLTDEPRRILVVDLFGLTAEEVRGSYPATFQHVLTHVKPERDENKRQSRRTNWWIFGEPNKELRKMLAGLTRYIATTETAKHRMFQFLGAEVLPDNKLIVIALEDAFHLGVLSSRVHVVYALAAGSWLGVGNDPVYAKSRCFDPFPFPLCGEAERGRIRALAEALDAHRKRVQAQHPGLTLTGMYNVLEKLRAASANPAALPHPIPLPLGEGTAALRARETNTPASGPAPGTLRPLRAGEGRGENSPNESSRLEPLNRRGGSGTGDRTRPLTPTRHSG